MQDTGIVRRMDELGRVVIPKEIRKTLRIKEGDPLEIFTDREQLVLKKYSPIITLETQAKSIAKDIDKLLNKQCVITDTDKIVFISNNKNKEMLDKRITREFENLLKERKSVILSKADGGEIIPICENCQDDICNQIIVPIIANGDCYGSICLIDNDTQNKFSLVELKVTQMCGCIISSQFEC